MRQTKLLVLGIILAGALGPSWHASTASASVVSGETTFTLTCADGRLPTRAEFKRVGDVIEQIRIRCTSIVAATGVWATPEDHTYTEWSGSDAPSPTTTSYPVSCASNNYIVTTDVYRTTRLEGLAIACQRAGAFLAPVSGIAGTAGVGGPRLAQEWILHQKCPNSGYANGVTGRRRQSLETLALTCVAPITPALLFPRWNATSPGEDYGASPGWTVRVQPVANATRYQICLRDAGSQSCYFNETLIAMSAAASKSAVILKNIPQFAVTIPADRQSTISQWTARACNSSNQCGVWAAPQSFTVVPSPPPLLGPSDKHVFANSRTVTFTWKANSAATAGYQLVLWRTLQESGYSVYNPAAPLPAPHQNIQIPPGATSYTYTLPPGLTAVRWGMYSCANFANKGRRCSLDTQPRSFTVPVQ